MGSRGGYVDGPRDLERRAAKIDDDPVVLKCSAENRDVYFVCQWYRHRTATTDFLALRYRLIGEEVFSDSSSRLVTSRIASGYQSLANSYDGAIELFVNKPEAMIFSCEETTLEIPEPQYRGLGLGTSLLAKVVEKVKHLYPGYTFAPFSVPISFSDNKYVSRLVAFLSRFGFDSTHNTKLGCICCSSIEVRSVPGNPIVPDVAEHNLIDFYVTNLAMRQELESKRRDARTLFRYRTFLIQRVMGQYKELQRTRATLVLCSVVYVATIVMLLMAGEQTML